MLFDYRKALFGQTWNFSMTPAQHHVGQKCGLNHKLEVLSNHTKFLTKGKGVKIPRGKIQ